MEKAVNRSLYIFLWGTLLLSWSLIQADSVMDMDIDQGPYGSETLPSPQETAYPFKFSANANFIGKAKFKKDKQKGQHLQYNDEEVNARLIYFYNPDYKEGAYLTLGYNHTHLKWNENPYFEKHDFRVASLTLGAFTHRICNWLWLGALDINVDTDHVDFEYTNYDALLWGRYAYRSDLGVNIGLIVETGMKIDHLYPIFGIDWDISEKWKLNLIYPVNVSILYQFSKNWSISLAARAFKTRNRVGSHEPLPKGIIMYQNTGAEINLEYDEEEKLSANIYGGYTFGGTLKIANRHYEHKHRFPFKSAGYVGGEVGVKF